MAESTVVAHTINEQRAIDWQNLEKANLMIKTTPIKGKDYAEVNQRVRAFRSLYPLGCIETSIISINEKEVTMQAKVFDDCGNLLASGVANEKANATQINRTSHIENCETSAIGRALGFAGFGVAASIASADEVRQAMAQQEDLDKKKATAKSKATTKKEATPPPSATQPKQEPLPQGDNKAVGKEVLEQKQAVSHLIEVLSSKNVTTGYVSKAFGVDRLTDLTKEQCAFAEKSAEAFASIEKVGVPFERVYKAYKCKKVTDLTDGQLLGIANNAEYFKKNYGDK